MDDPQPHRARWRITSLVAALLCVAPIGWHLRSTPVTALVTSAILCCSVLALTEIVRRRVNRDRRLDADWRQAAEEWRRRYL